MNARPPDWRPTRLTPQQRDKVRKRLAAGERVDDLAVEYGVSHREIHTPAGSRRREVDALIPILIDPDNQDKSPEDIAEELIGALDDLRSQTHRIAVVAQYQWTGGEPTVAVLGPFSTLAPAAARKVGGEMAGTTQGGSGRFMLVPAYANVRAAWDAIKPAGKQEKRLERFLASVHREAPTTWGPMSGFGPTCCCGVKPGSWCLVHKKLNPPRAA